VIGSNLRYARNRQEGGHGEGWLLSLVRVCAIVVLLVTLALSGLVPAAAQVQANVAAPAPSADSSAALIFIQNAGLEPGSELPHSDSRAIAP
jgi:hypothetical protein